MFVDSERFEPILFWSDGMRWKNYVPRWWRRRRLTTAITIRKTTMSFFRVLFAPNRLKLDTEKRILKFCRCSSVPVCPFDTQIALQNIEKHTITSKRSQRFKSFFVFYSFHRKTKYRFFFFINSQLNVWRCTSSSFQMIFLRLCWFSFSSSIFHCWLTLRFHDDDDDDDEMRYELRSTYVLRFTSLFWSFELKRNKKKTRTPKLRQSN